MPEKKENKAAKETVELLFERGGHKAPPKALLDLIDKQGKQKEVLHEQNKATEICLKAGFGNHQPIRDLVGDLNKGTD